ncbi:MAG: hypothetical protein IKG36_02715 [Mycoplasmataceae bacterium]|nr:hypothetical protein [Mycoplasmataceae bacterium]
MLFEEKIKETNYRPTDKITKVRLDLEPKRENNLQKINKVYSKEVFSNNKRLGRSKIIKMAIDNLIADVEEQASEEEAIEYLRNLYKEAEF